MNDQIQITDPGNSWTDLWFKSLKQLDWRVRERIGEKLIGVSVDLVKHTIHEHLVEDQFHE
jgi:hypothetical protein